MHRIGVRGLLTAVGLPYKNNEEAAAVPQLLQKLQDLADDAGGPAPLPARPDTSLVDDLLGKHGNEQFVAVYEARDALSERLQCLALGQGAKGEPDSPRWQVLQRLLTHADNRPVAYQVRPQAQAILTNRSLLADPDPVKPLVAELSADLRAAAPAGPRPAGRMRATASWTRSRNTDEWRKLSDEQWEKIFHANGLGPVEPLAVGTEEQLLATLDAKPLTTWEDWILAIPARIVKAREQAAKLLEPKAVRVYPKAATLHTTAEVDAYLARPAGRDRAKGRSGQSGHHLAG